MRRLITSRALFTALVLFAVSLVGAASAQPGRRAAPEWIPITGTSWAYAVPPDWQNVQPPPSSDASTMIVSTATAPPSSRGRFPNVTLVIEAFGQGDARVYGRGALQMVSQVATIVSSRDTMAGPTPSFDIEAQWPNNQPPTHALQRVAVARGLAHILTCSDTVAAYPQSAPTCQRLMESFRVR